MNFEQQLQKLDSIVKTLEKGGISLDEATNLYSEASNLAKECFKSLDESRGKIKMIKQDLDKFMEVDFNTDN